jgi:hypothetical protein
VAIASSWASGDGSRVVDGGPDVVSGGPAGRPRSLSRRIAISVVVALVLGAAIWVTNRQLAAREASTLATCVQTSERTLAAIDSQLALTAKYVAPQVGPDSSLLIRDSLYRLIENSATGDVPALDGAINRCDQVAIAPQYHRLSAARGAYVAYLDAELAHLQDITRDGTAQARVPPELAPLLARARAALAAAVPDRSERERVAKALAGG